MPSKIFNITHESAVHVAKYYVKLKADDPATGFVERMALNAALSNGKIEEIFEMLRSLGFSISGREDNPTHQEWLRQGSIVRSE